MRDTVLTLAFADDEGRPDGGISDGPGFTVSWQRGPLVLPDGTELPRNGAFVEEVLGACRDRLVTLALIDRLPPLPAIVDTSRTAYTVSFPAGWDYETGDGSLWAAS